jgi:hypothetical protein
MDYRCNGKGGSQAKGMGKLSRPGEGLLDPVKSLVRIAEKPQEPGQLGQIGYTGVRPVKVGMGVVLLRIKQRNPIARWASRRNAGLPSRCARVRNCSPTSRA